VLVDRLIIEDAAPSACASCGRRNRRGPRQGEVILSAGSIGSTQILHRSGIGPSDWLTPLGIDVAVDRQGVGRNLQDHLQQRRDLQGFGVRTLNETYYICSGAA